MITLCTLTIGIVIIYLVARYAIQRATSRVIHKHTGQPLKFGPWYEYWLHVLRIRKQTIFMEYDGNPDTQLQGQWFLFSPTVFVTDWRDIKTVLRSPDFDKVHKFFGNIGYYFEDSVLFSGREKWHHQRSLLNRAFTPNRINQYQDVFTRTGLDFLSILESLYREENSDNNDSHNNDNEGDNKNNTLRIDIEDWAERFTFDVIGKLGFGLDFNALRHPDNSIYLDARLTFGSIVFGTAFSTLFPFTEYSKRLNNALENTLAIVKRMVKERRRIQLEREQSGQDKYENLLDYILNLSEKEILNNIFVFFLAGAETSVSVFTSLFYYVSRDSEIQRRIQEELHTVLESDGIVRHEHIPKLSFLGHVLKEVLRLRTPTVVIGQRIAVRDTELGDYLIPKGTTIGCSLSRIHTDRKIWGPDAMVFNPDRWGSMTSDNPEHDALRFIPFSWGLRRCIGERFAWNEMMTMLGMFFYRHSIATDPEYVMRNQNFTVSQRPVEKLMVDVSLNPYYQKQKQQ